jgi:hypothetical protein
MVLPPRKPHGRSNCQTSLVDHDMHGRSHVQRIHLGQELSEKALAAIHGWRTPVICPGQFAAPHGKKPPTGQAILLQISH